MKKSLGSPQRVLAEVGGLRWTDWGSLRDASEYLHVLHGSHRTQLVWAPSSRLLADINSRMGNLVPRSKRPRRFATGDSHWSQNLVRV